VEVGSVVGRGTTATVSFATGVRAPVAEQD
jgi:hypothetical protein